MPPIQYGEKKGASEKDKAEDDRFCSIIRKLPAVRYSSFEAFQRATTRALLSGWAREAM
jgi:hypothetical protein